MKTDAMCKTITVGEGRPPKMRHSIRADIFRQLSPGKFVQVTSADDLKSVGSGLYWYIKTHHLPWRVAVRSRELRLYIVEAESV